MARYPQPISLCISHLFTQNVVSIKSAKYHSPICFRPKVISWLADRTVMSHSSRKRIKSLSSINSLIVVPAYSRYWHTSIAYPGIIFVMCHQPVLCSDWEHFELHDMACVQLIISRLYVYNNYPSLLLLCNSEAESLLSVLINLRRVNIKLFLHPPKL